MTNPFLFKYLFLCFVVLLSTCGGSSSSSSSGAPSTSPGITAGPLVVNPANPRYFKKSSGETVYLTGSHTWQSLKDRGPSDPPEAFNYNEYLDFLKEHNHNFIRMWTLEETNFINEKGQHYYVSPFPWPRPGPGMAHDGKPKFDLTILDQAFFDRLRSRVVAARERGIYVSVMFFEGWAIGRAGRWPGNPFHKDNNVNGINGDPKDTGVGLEVNTLDQPEITALQEEYVKKVIDTLNDLDNVLWEIANETHSRSDAWQNYFIRFVKEYEKLKPFQHPVGMTFIEPQGDNSRLFNSDADWTSPGNMTYFENEKDPYKVDPPETDGAKVVLLDTDHLWGIGGNHKWVWKSFLRGYNPIFMDPYKETERYPPGTEGQFELVRKAMGDTLRYANKMDMQSMKPAGNLASSGYCLAKPGWEYLLYFPSGKSATLDLSNASGNFALEWFNPVSEETLSGGMVAGGGNVSFNAPSGDNWVLYLKRK